MTSSSSSVGASVSRFKGSTSHDFMIWLAEWKKYLVYQGVHHIILDGVDSQGQLYNASVDFKIFEPEFFSQFYNNEIIKSQREEEDLIRNQILLEWPWFVAYYSRKHLTVDQVIGEGAKRCDIPSKAELIVCLEELNLTPLGSGDLPYPTIELARSAAQLTDRQAIVTAAENGDQNAIEMLEESSHIQYVMAEQRKKVNYMDVSVIIKKVAKLRLLNRQIKNEDELEADMEAIALELGDPIDKKDWPKYISTKLGFQKPAYDLKLREAHENNQKRSLKHSDQVKKCLDCLALLGDLKCIPDAEAAIAERDYHRCFLAVDNHYMLLGGQDTELFRKEVESYRIQLGQDLNSHLDLLQHAIERWLNIELMESKLLELGSQIHSTTPGNSKLSASKFVLDHPEVAYNNSYDLTDAEILAKGTPTMILLSEAKRFTIYSNSVKSNPRFKRIIEAFHTKDESMRTVRSLLAAIRNFELSNSGRDLLSEERRQNPNWPKDLKSYLDNIQRRDSEGTIINTPVKEKSVSFTTTDKAFTERSSQDQEKAKSDRQPRNRSEIQDGDIPHCDNHPSSKTHWTWECNYGKKGISSSKTPNKLAGESREQNPLGCVHCFSNPKLRKNSLNHSFEECKLKPGGGKYKQSSADRSQASVNNVQLKAAIRDVLNEPSDKKRSRDDKEEGEEKFYPGRPLGSDPNDFEMDSSEDSNDQPKKNKKRGKK